MRCASVNLLWCSSEGFSYSISGSETSWKWEWEWHLIFFPFNAPTGDWKIRLWSVKIPKNMRVLEYLRSQSTYMIAWQISYKQPWPPMINDDIKVSMEEAQLPSSLITTRRMDATNWNFRQRNERKQRRPRLPRLFLSVRASDVLFQNHDSMIFRQSSNPVCGSWKR